MTAPVLADLQAAVATDTTVKASAATLIRGISGRIQDAVNAALANGATAAELQPVQDEVNAMNTSSSDLAAAVEENTPAATASAKHK